MIEEEEQVELADRVSEKVIKILYNIKGSVRNDVAKWTQNIDASKEEKSKK